MIDVKNPFEVKILLVYENLQAQNAASRAVRKLKEDLEIEGSNIIIADNLEDARAIFYSDPSIQCVLIGVECNKCANTFSTLEYIREHNSQVPIYIMSSKNMASQIPADI